jgi:hypothetical protein
VGNHRDESIGIAPGDDHKNVRTGRLFHRHRSLVRTLDDITMDEFCSVVSYASGR